jgi:hypothetical protein
MKVGSKVEITKEGQRLISLRKLGIGLVLKQVQGTLSQEEWYLVKFEDETLEVSAFNLVEV